MKANVLIRSDLIVFKISGSDRVDFLNRLCSQKVVSTKTGEVLPSAFLKANGTPVALFHLWIRENDVVLIARKSLENQVSKFIDVFHFGEDIQLSKWEDINVCELRQNQFEFSPLSTVMIKGPHAILPIEAWTLKNTQEVIQRVYVLSASTGEGVGEGVAKDFGGELLSEKDDFMQRAYAGIPKHPEELTESNIILEGPFGEYVHRNKGCYPGQEVIERIYTYGNVAKKIFTFKINGPVSDTEAMKHAEIYAEGKPVGNILSLQNTSDGVMGFAIVKRLPLENKQRLEVIDSTGRHLIFSL